MKNFLLLCCFLGVAYAEVSLHAVLQAKWNNFKATHSKEYARHEEPKRLNAFLQNSLHIEQHNERHAKGLETYQLSHNHLSDMTEEEFKSTLTLQLPSEAELSNVTQYQYQHGLSSSLVGNQVDWTSSLPPVKNQGSCGSCYSFGSLVPMEAMLARKLNVKQISLSEQQIVDCSSSYGNNGCNGGFMTNVYNYVKANGGVVVNSAYPYTASAGSCKNVGGSKYANVQRYVGVTTEPAMTQAVQTIGPLAVAVQAGIRSFQMYSSGVYTDTNCGSGGIDHAVAVVGAGNANGVNYYLVRNSWGTGWGEGGYMRMARNICQVTKYGYYPIL